MGKTRHLSRELLAQSAAPGNSAGKAALEVAAPRRYGRLRLPGFPENPKRLKDKQETLACA